MKSLPWTLPGPDSCGHRGYLEAVQSGRLEFAGERRLGGREGERDLETDRKAGRQRERERERQRETERDKERQRDRGDIGIWWCPLL